MAMTGAGGLAEYVGLPAATQFTDECDAEAQALVAGFLGVPPSQVYWSEDIPIEVVARAVLEVAAELFHRKNTKNAVAQFASPDGAPVRIARDPMVAAYPLLRPWVGGGFA